MHSFSNSLSVLAKTFSSNMLEKIPAFFSSSNSFNLSQSSFGLDDRKLVLLLLLLRTLCFRETTKRDKHKPL